MNVHTIALSGVSLKFNPDEASPMIFKTCHPLVVQLLNEANSSTEEERKALGPLGCCDWIVFIICLILIFPVICFIVYLGVRRSKNNKAFVEKLRILQAKYNPQLNQHGVNAALREQIYVTGGGRHQHTSINYYFEFTFGQPFNQMNPVNQMNQHPMDQGYSNQVYNQPPAEMGPNQGNEEQKLTIR